MPNLRPSLVGRRGVSWLLFLDGQECQIGRLGAAKKQLSHFHFRKGDSPIFVERKLGQSPTYSFAGPYLRRVLEGSTLPRSRPAGCTPDLRHHSSGLSSRHGIRTPNRGARETAGGGRRRTCRSTGSFIADFAMSPRAWRPVGEASCGTVSLFQREPVDPNLQGRRAPRIDPDRHRVDGLQRGSFPFPFGAAFQRNDEIAPALAFFVVFPLA
jgi:hypothetical protein